MTTYGAETVSGATNARSGSAADREPATGGPIYVQAGRRWAVRALGIGVAAVIFVPMLLDASVGVWTGALALGVAFALTAVGVYLTFRVLDFPDLTVDASFAAGGAVVATAITNGWNPWVAMAGALLVGAMFGALTGILHLTLKINSLLASILTVTAAFTINLRIQGRSNTPLLGVDTVFSSFATTVRGQMESLFGAAGVQNHRTVTTALIAGLLVVVITVMLARFLRTEIGIGIRATGDNSQMANAQGLDTRRYLVGGVALSNGLVGLSGALVAQHQGFADVNSGNGLIIGGLAAVIIGEVLFAGRGGILRHLVAVSLGMILYRAVIAVSLASDVDLPGFEPIQLEATDVRLATAVVVCGLLAVPRLRDAQRKRRNQR